MPRTNPPNQTGNSKTTDPSTEGAETPDGYKREDFFRDLKKVVKKLPPDHPSRSGSQKR